MTYCEPAEMFTFPNSTCQCLLREGNRHRIAERNNILLHDSDLAHMLKQCQVYSRSNDSISFNKK